MQLRWAVLLAGAMVLIAGILEADGTRLLTLSSDFVF